MTFKLDVSNPPGSARRLLQRLLRKAFSLNFAALSSTQKEAPVEMGDR